MNTEEKYNKLRAAILEVVGVPDDRGILLGMLNELHKLGAGQEEDGQTVLTLLVALIETHGEEA